MTHIRPATIADAETICYQRLRMFVDSGLGSESVMPPIINRFRGWLTPRLANGTYLGWLVEEEKRTIAGIGMWLMDYPPNFRDPAGTRAYVMNMYVAPEMRRQGLARQLVDAAVQEARSREIKVVTLHATKLGRDLYEQYGFKPTTEMMLQQEL
jgi:GNAT superfamily N-acetyltransferase